MYETLTLERSEPSDFDQLYQRYAQKIFNYTYRHVHTFEDAEDILVEVFLAALENETFAQLDQSGQQAWLWRVARNKIADLYRRDKRHPLLSLHLFDEERFAQDDANPEVGNLVQEQEEQLRQLLEALPATQKEVVRLRFLHNWRCPQIATTLGKSENAVRTLLSRALSSLRKLYITQDREELH